MNALFTAWQASPLWQLAGWTMCYFLVLGSLVALAGGLVRFLCNRLNPSLRYATSLAVFATLALMPVGIAAWLAQEALTNAPHEEATPTATAPAIDLAQPHIAPPSGREPTTSAAPTAVFEPFSHPEGGAMYARSVDEAVAYLP